LVAAIKSDYRRAQLSVADRRMLDFAVRLTADPASWSDAAAASLQLDEDLLLYPFHQCVELLLGQVGALIGSYF